MAKKINFHDLTCAFENKMAREYRKQRKAFDKQFNAFVCEAWKKAKMDEKIRESAKHDTIIADCLADYGEDYLDLTLETIIEGCRDPHE